MVQEVLIVTRVLGVVLDFQQTVASSVVISGIGLHTGVKVSVRLCPAPANTGIIFKRIDLEGFRIEASSRHIARVSYATSLMKKGVLISTTEHLLSALAGLRLDNVMVEIDNLELPILDGSARPFVEALAKAGVRRQRARRMHVKVLKTVEIAEGGKRIAVHPSETLRMTYRINFPHPLIGQQELEFTPGVDDYAREIAPARTFGFIEEVEMLRRSGLIRGGSLENAVVLTREGVLNPAGLRFPNEFCRHKMLDLIGDLALLGRPLIGQVIAERAGHALHAQLVSQLLRQKDAWTLVSEAESPSKALEPRAAELAASGVS
ncbi:MAG: UDP-3-O-acyl-N-acetylglucosamine deacetylase [Acidobacteriia bacterium]|nr:UDP-3-O-acyl-N-acetylglucosamine deacetylase [Terriglobia bacterium]